MRVRAATPTDHAAWLALRQTLWTHATRAELNADIVAYFSGRGLLQQVLLGEGESGPVLGMIELSLRPYADGCRSSPVAYVEGWFVAPDMRRRGVGRALLAAAEAWARSIGVTEMASDSYLDNAISEAAHRALGFDEEERVIHWRKNLR